MQNYTIAKIMLYFVFRLYLQIIWDLCPTLLITGLSALMGSCATDTTDLRRHEANALLAPVCNRGVRMAWITNPRQRETIDKIKNCLLSL